MLKPIFVSALLAALATASPALAWQNGGTYTGPKGGAANWTYGCGAYGRFCGRRWTATTPGGQTYNGGAGYRRTWYGGVTSRYISARSRSS